jgi:metallopeptidase MepB
MNLSSLYNSIRRDITGLLGPEEEGGGCNWGCGHTRFSHLFIGYDAGYYCYSLATVFAYDLFAAKFASDPLNREEGRRYRRIVLERGGSRPEMKFLEEYLGRKPSGEAFARMVGK